MPTNIMYFLDIRIHKMFVIYKQTTFKLGLSSLFNSFSDTYGFKSPNLSYVPSDTKKTIPTKSL